MPFKFYSFDLKNKTLFGPYRNCNPYIMFEQVLFTTVSTDLGNKEFLFTFVRNQNVSMKLIEKKFYY